LGYYYGKYLNMEQVRNWFIAILHEIDSTLSWNE
jgi:hypothetical protein